MDKVEITFKDGEKLIAYGGRVGFDGKYYCYKQNHYESGYIAIEKEEADIKVIEENSLDLSDIKPVYHPSVPPDKRI